MILAGFLSRAAVDSFERSPYTSVRMLEKLLQECKKVQNTWTYVVCLRPPAILRMPF